MEMNFCSQIEGETWTIYLATFSLVLRLSFAEWEVASFSLFVPPLKMEMWRFDDPRCSAFFSSSC
jgi:hypothetical protein